MSMWFRRNWGVAPLCAVTLAVAVALLAADSSLAAGYFAGKAQMPGDPRVLIHRSGPNAIDQVVYEYRASCSLNGKKTDAASGGRELRAGRIHGKSFAIDRLVSGPSTGVTPPKYLSRSAVRGHFHRNTVKGYIRQSSVDRHHGTLRCDTGKRRAKLHRVDRRRYMRLLAETPFGRRR